MLISLENATKMFGDRIIVMGANLKIEREDRIGLVGANGAGKSTLLGMIYGDLALDEGVRAVQSGVNIGFMRQDSGIDSTRTIREEMRACFAPLLAAHKRMREMEANPEYARNAQMQQEYAKLQTYFEANDGYRIDSRIDAVLDGMGFAKEGETVCATLSGGEKTRLALARLLLQSPDVLILDEPTNHLDFKTLEWLEMYLQSYRGALVVVSHDRYFLDRISTKIWEISNLRLTTYKGNYSKYIQTREMVYERQRKEYEMQQKNVAKLTDYIARNKMRASTAGMAKSREKMLARVVEAEKKPPRALHSVRMSFRYENEPVKDILSVERLTLSVGQGTGARTLCSDVDFSLQRGEKVAIVGHNGVGKSTFLKTIAGQRQADSGKITWGKNVKLSYFAQDHLQLNGEKTVLQELWDRFPATYERDVRNVLGNLQFVGEAVNKRVDMLSGGEKARLKFAIMMYEEGNVLLLDEPTNHLDIATREVLDRALMDYSGTVLTVSHDRYLLSRVPSRIVEMTPMGFVSYDGGYESYVAKRAGEIAQQEKAEEQPKSDQPNASNGYYRSKKQRALDTARKKRLLLVEQEISDTELEIAMTQDKLEQPEVSSDYQKVTELCTLLEQKRVRLNELIEEWAELSSEMDG